MQAQKKIAVATAGPVGAAFAIYEKNWICSKCNTDNFPTRRTCRHCYSDKPDETNTVIKDEALANLEEGKDSKWREALDPKSLHIYYYNTDTGETQWTRPEVMGPAPKATGWFGRGTNDPKRYSNTEEQMTEYIKRPARKQIEEINSKYHQRKEGSYEYNIWYGRWLGDNWNEFEPDERAEYRCNIHTDCGYTKADLDNGNKKKRDKRFFCIHFARGCCYLGQDCEFYHRIPTRYDTHAMDVLHDCFGRERHKDHREDMGGVGCIDDPCRTLYVAGLKRNPMIDLEHELWKQFSDFGELESIHIVERIMVAFIRYRIRSSAEFAKVAMWCQDLGNGEILNIRWAREDPNPVAKEAAKRADQDAVVVGMQAKGISTVKTDFMYPASYQLPDLVNLVPTDDTTQYPNTDYQYINDNTTSSADIYDESDPNVVYSADMYENATRQLEAERQTRTVYYDNTYINSSNTCDVGNADNHQEDPNSETIQHKDDTNINDITINDDNVNDKIIKNDDDSSSKPHPTESISNNDGQVDTQTTDHSQG